MLKQLVNECLIDLTITPDGPLLIKSGLASLSGPDMTFVTTWRNGNQEVYLPGSSLKGTLRSHAERIARTLNPAAACNPFATKRGAPDLSCGYVFEKRSDPKDNPDLPDSKDLDQVNQTVYRESCPICRLFGSTWYAGRLATADAYSVGPAPRPQQRDGVGIDRFTGGAAHGVKFDLEVVTEGTFATQLHLRNFELWQLGLVGFVLNDLADGLIRVGANKSRGLGRVRGKIERVRLDFLGPRAVTGKLLGAGSLVTEEMAQAYGLAHPDSAGEDLPVPGASNGLRTTYMLEGAAFPWAAVAPRWVELASTYQTPAAMARRRGAH